MSVARGWAELGGTVALVAVLAACSASPRTPDSQPVPTASTATNAAIGDAPTATPSAVDQATFVSPSGNIGCYLDRSGARCDIVRRNWQPPAAPADCELDWGGGLSVAAGKATFTCAGDTVVGAGDELPYGKSLRAGNFTCSSDSSAMRCENTKSGHGFTLAIEQYELF